MLIKISKKIVWVFALILTIYFLNILSGAGVNNLNIDADNLEFERILFVPGINTPKFYLIRWEKDLITNFPTKEIIILNDDMYIYWQDDKTKVIVGKGVDILNDGKATIIFAHSYGGVLAKTMISRAGNANVVKLITMASPHQMDGFGIDESKDFLETPEEVNVPTFSFGGYVDPVVLFPFTNVSDTENLDDPNHQDLWSGHGGFLFDKNIRKKVLEYAFGVEIAEEID